MPRWLSAKCSAGVGLAMAAWCNICLLDSRQHRTLQLVLDEVARVRAAFHGTVVAFLLTFLDQPVEVWTGVLQRAYQGVPNVTHYECPEGQYILCFGHPHADVRIVHAQCLEAPPDVGATKYTAPMVYLELAFHSGHSRETTVAVLWVPGLFCTNGYQLSDTAYRGALGFLKATAALQRARTLSPEYARSLLSTTMSDEPIKKACHIVQKHLSAFMLIVNGRSGHFDGAYPILTWHMSGNMHAVFGTLREGKFADIMDSDRICTWPACFRVRAMKKAYFLPHHSLKFWAPLFDNESESQSEPPATCDEDTHSRGIAPTMENVGKNDARQTSARAQNELRDPECMICLSRPPTFVFQACGHMGVCGPCRKWMCKHEYNKGKTSRRRAPGELTMEKVGSVRVRCPLCMGPTRMVYKDTFRGKTYQA